jgi:uncharacterized repeat protein (TIGR02543 family)
MKRRVAMAALLFAGCKDYYTVTFNAQHGTPGTQTRIVAGRGSLGSNMPEEPVRNEYAFDSWYTSPGSAGSQFTPATTVTSDTTVYAKWIKRYTVTFNADGEVLAEEARRRRYSEGAAVRRGVSMPSDPTKSGYDFGGWYTGQAGAGSQFTSATTVTGNRTVYAKWTIAAPSDLSLADSLAWITSNAVEGGAYAITVHAGETVTPKTLSYNGKKVSVTLEGGETEQRIMLGSTGSLFTVGNGVTLTLRNNITLEGRSDNMASLIKINSGGTLVMNASSTVTGNTSSSLGSGVCVYSGTFTMSGGTISGNTTSSGGGGVYVGSGTFTMSGGTISGNTSSSGDGVCVFDSGTFIKQSGGVIYGSDASASLKNTASSDSNGHAVYVNSSPAKRRDSTAGEGDTLNSLVSGSSGGWE